MIPVLFLSSVYVGRWKFYVENKKTKSLFGIYDYYMTKRVFVCKLFWLIKLSLWLGELKNNILDEV